MYGEDSGGAAYVHAPAENRRQAGCPLGMGGSALSPSCPAAFNSTGTSLLDAMRGVVLEMLTLCSEHYT